MNAFFYFDLFMVYIPACKKEFRTELHTEMRYYSLQIGKPWYKYYETDTVLCFAYFYIYKIMNEKQMS